MPKDTELPKPSLGLWLRSMRTPILISGALPVLLYLLLSSHLSHLIAFALSGVPALLYAAQGWVRRRSIDLISAITLFTVAGSVLTGFLVHDPHVLLIRDSCLAAAFGVPCLLSLLTPRPIGYYLYRWAVVRDPAELARLDAGWTLPYARFVRRLVTAVWGIAFDAEALIDAFLAYHLPITRFVVIHPVFIWGTQLAAFGWGLLYARHAQPRIEASLRQATNELAPAIAAAITPSNIPAPR